MPEFSREEREKLREYASDFYSKFVQEVFSPVKSALIHLPLTRIKTITDDLCRLANEMHKDGFSLQTNDIRYIKSIVLFQKKHTAEKQEKMRASATDPTIFEEIEELMTPIQTFMSQEWFAETEAMVMPKAIDFITLEAAYKYLGDKIKPNLPMQYDEKFGILQAPGSFFSRLSNCRAEASLRNVETSIAFIDIDNFKQFNTDYTETRVDRDVLPAIMRTLESHIFSHGLAFRFGGDEYMLLLPNTSLEAGKQLLLSLQVRLQNLRMSGITRLVTVSIGLCTISPESLLTDKEIQQFANNAKEHAKREGGKNCVAYYQNEPSDSEPLEIVRNGNRDYISF